MKLLIATNNRGKLEEYGELLRGLPVDLVSPSDERVELEVDETGQTFAENAVLKAQAFAVRSGLVTLADDSGLEVDALNGEPGVFSARYDGTGGTDVSRYMLLLEKMKAVPWENRSARFRCVIALALPEFWATRPIGEGRCEGYIAAAPEGEHGFGYDPVFFVPEFGMSMAQLPPEIKNRISHRARATEVAKQALAEQFYPEALDRRKDNDRVPQTSEIRIRPAVFADHVSLHRNCYPCDQVGAVRERLRWAVTKSREGVLLPLVGEAGDEIVAYVQLHLRRGVGEISSLVVMERMRGRGLARALIHVVREIVRDRDIHILTVVVDPHARRLHEFYKGLGFSPYKMVGVPRAGYVSAGLYLKHILD